MVIDRSLQLSKIIKKEIEKILATQPCSFPCKIEEVIDSVYVKVKPLGKSKKFFLIPLMQSPYFRIPVKKGDIGIALSCDFLFDIALDDKEIKESQKAINRNGLFFIPLASKKNALKEKEDLVLISQNSKNSISLTKDSISLTGGIFQKEKILIKTDAGGLMDVVQSLMSMMDLLASGMNGSGTNAGAYQGGKDAYAAKIKQILGG